GGQVATAIEPQVGVAAGTEPSGPKSPEPHESCPGSRYFGARPGQIGQSCCHKSAGTRATAPRVEWHLSSENQAFPRIVAIDLAKIGRYIRPTLRQAVSFFQSEWRFRASINETQTLL